MEVDDPGCTLRPPGSTLSTEAMNGEHEVKGNEAGTNKQMSEVDDCIYDEQAADRFDMSADEFE